MNSIAPSDVQSLTTINEVSESVYTDYFNNQSSSSKTDWNITSSSGTQSAPDSKISVKGLSEIEEEQKEVQVIRPAANFKMGLVQAENGDFISRSNTNGT